MPNIRQAKSRSATSASVIWGGRASSASTTSRRDLRKDKRYIVELEHGKCRLQKECRTCNSFHKIPELRGKNMTINEKLYARMYTKTFLRKGHARYYLLPNEELSKVISNYLKK